MADAVQAKATQEFVPIKEVRNGVVILKDGSLRSIVMASSINLALKSQEEQQAIIAQFQNFLNSLEFTAQFFVQSRDLDIRPYIALLEDRYQKELDDLMRIQIREYIAFIKDFTERANIMSKNFFIVVPYDPAIAARGGGLSSLIPGRADSSATLTDEQFEQYRTQLEQRMSVVEQGLVRTGVRVVQLGTEEVIELFYKLFNPGELEKPLQVTQMKH
jgi:type IV secretory pathway VirB4 component